MSTLEGAPSWCYPESSYFSGNPVTVKEAELMLKGALHPSAALFLESLNVSLIHPFCNSWNYLEQESSPSLSNNNTHHSLPVLIYTLYKQVIPALAAMSELWLRLFAFYVTPFCICYLIHLEIVPTTRQLLPPTRRSETFVLILSLSGLLSASVLFTDPLYVHEFGRSFGAVLFGTMCLLTIRQFLLAMKHETTSSIRNNNDEEGSAKNSSFRFWWYGLGFLLVFYQVIYHLILCPEQTLADIPQHEPGLYYDKTNDIMRAIVQHWPQNTRTYDSTYLQKTPWTITGDSRTGIPFLVHSIVPRPRYHRVWVSSDSDTGEANALDIAFPPNGRLNKEMPFYILLHGLNGGSDEEYVKEFVMRQTRRGSTVAVMIARGLMGTPVIGNQVFHGARVSDIHQVTKIIKQQLLEGHLVVGVGYSMGGIIIANYVARYGESCQFDAAVAVSGGLDMREQINFHRSMRLWQPMLAQSLRDTIMKGARQKYEERLSEKQFLELLRASHVKGIDEHAVVTYNGYDNIMHYYSDMSAMGDYYSSNQTGRISNVSIPLCIIHALDDPLITWRAAVGPDKPENVVKSGKGYLLVLLTKSGGHVGWPLGINPKNYGWKWMHGAVEGFVDAFMHVSRKSSASDYMSTNN